MTEDEEPADQEEKQPLPNDASVEPGDRRNRFTSHEGELIITPPPAADTEKQ